MSNAKRALAVLDAWDLLKPNFDVSLLSLTDLREIGRALEKAHSADGSKGRLGSVHLGSFGGTMLAEGRIPIETLGTSLIAFDTVWLPDPIFSFLSESACKAHELLPDGGSDYFFRSGNFSGMRIQWRPLWSLPKDQRRAAVRNELPLRLKVVASLRAVIESDAVDFIAWEIGFIERLNQIRQFVFDATSHPLATEVAQRFPQDRYALGPRVGGIGIAAKNGFEDEGLRPGSPMWFGDKTQVFLNGCINASISSDTNASFMPDLPGDRVVYDFLLRAGEIAGAQVALADSIKLPSLAAATWPDIVAIRNDLDSLRELRELIRTASGANEVRVLDDLRERIAELSRRIEADRSIWRQFPGSPLNFAIGALTGIFAGVLLDESPKSVAIKGAVGIGSVLLNRLYQAAQRYGAAQKRVELIGRISNRL